MAGVSSSSFLLYVHLLARMYQALKPTLNKKRVVSTNNNLKAGGERDQHRLFTHTTTRFRRSTQGLTRGGKYAAFLLVVNDATDELRRR